MGPYHFRAATGSRHGSRKGTGERGDTWRSICGVRLEVSPREGSSSSGCWPSEGLSRPRARTRRSRRGASRKDRRRPRPRRGRAPAPRRPSRARRSSRSLPKRPPPSPTGRSRPASAGPFASSRHDVWAQDAKVFRVDAGGRTEIPRSSLVFFWGSDTDGAGSRVLVSVDPRTRTLTALVHGPEGVREIARDASDAAGRYLLAEPLRPKGVDVKCGQEDFPDTAWLPGPCGGTRGEPGGAPSSSARSTRPSSRSTRTRSTSRPSRTTRRRTTNYIATLVANINVMYERDLNLRLVIGTTFLRTGSDPWNQRGFGREREPAERVHELLEHELPEVDVSAVLRGPLLGQEHVGPLRHRVDRGLRLRREAPITASTRSRRTGAGCGATRSSSATRSATTWAPRTRTATRTRRRTAASRASRATPGATSCPPAQTINGMTSVTGTIMSYCHLLGGCTSSLVFHPTHGQPVRRPRARRRRRVRVHRPRRAASSSPSSRLRRDDVPRRHALPPSRHAQPGGAARRPVARRGRPAVVRRDGQLRRTGRRRRDLGERHGREPRRRPATSSRTRTASRPPGDLDA